MPISNPHLKVPPGFGALLERLTREILRDQPKDIPKYAAEYFETLLKTREGELTISDNNLVNLANYIESSVFRK